MHLITLFKFILFTGNRNGRQFILRKVIVSTDNDNVRQTEKIENRMYESAFLYENPSESYRVYRQCNNKQIFLTKVIVSRDNDNVRQTEKIENRMYESAFLYEDPSESYRVYRQRNNKQIIFSTGSSPQITTTTDKQTL